MLKDLLNLQILENICTGNGVSVNISALAKSLGKHRNTIKTQVTALFKHNIITKPYYPFIELFNQCPLLAVVKADLPRNEQIEKFLVEDKRIFAAFWAWDEVYNTLIFEFHESMYSYYEWKEKIVKERKLPPLEHRAPADVLFLNNRLLVKYDPNSSVFCMERHFEEAGELVINDYRINELGFQIMKRLLRGNGIKTNENMLAKKLGVHRRTVERRINDLVKEGIILNPLSRFPKFFVPPKYILVVCLLRVNNLKDKVFEEIKRDTCIPIAYEGHTGPYNLLYFGTFPTVEKHFEWEENIHSKFPECFGAMKKIYLSPDMTASIDQLKVDLGLIRKKIEQVKEKKRKESQK